MTPPHPFRLFGPSHLAVLGVTAAVTAGLVLLARRSRRLAAGATGRPRDAARAGRSPSSRFLPSQALPPGVVAAVLFLPPGLGMRPRPRSILRAWLWLQAYVAVPALIDCLPGPNYGSLLRKPAQASLYDYLG